MNKQKRQQKITAKISFLTNYKYIELFDDFITEEIIGISSYEISSKTIEAKPEDIWEVHMFLADDIDLAQIKNQLAAFAQDNNIKILSDVNSEEIEDKDWVSEYQKQLKPIIVGRFFIGSKINLNYRREDKLPIYIEASRAFGTGEHATTSGCIEAMELLSRDNFENIIDIGTGTGLLSFAAEKIWPRAKIIACDIEPISVEIARINQSYNNSNVYFYQNSEKDLLIPENSSSKFDLIISNILSAPLIELANTFRSVAHLDTAIILSGFLDYQAPEIIKKYEKLGIKVKSTITKDSWITLTLKV